MNKFRLSELHQIEISGEGKVTGVELVNKYIDKLITITGKSFEGRIFIDNTWIISYEFDISEVEKTFDTFMRGLTEMGKIFNFKAVSEKFTMDVYIDTNPLANLQWKTIDYDSIMLLAGRKDAYGKTIAHVNLTAYLDNNVISTIKNNISEHALKESHVVYTSVGSYEIHIVEGGKLYAIVSKTETKSLATIKKEIENTTGVTIEDIVRV